MPPLARRPAAGRRAVPSRRVLAPCSGSLRARGGDGSATFVGLRKPGALSSVGEVEALLVTDSHLPVEVTGCAWRTLHAARVLLGDVRR